MDKKSKIFKIIFILLILTYFAYILLTQQKALNEYKAEGQSYAVQIKEAEETKKNLEKIKENLDSPQYIESIAREKLGMYLPNERVYIDISK